MPKDRDKPREPYVQSDDSRARSGRDRRAATGDPVRTATPPTGIPVAVPVPDPFGEDHTPTAPMKAPARPATQGDLGEVRSPVAPVATPNVVMVTTTVVRGLADTLDGNGDDKGSLLLGDGVVHEHVEQEITVNVPQFEWHVPLTEQAAVDEWRLEVEKWIKDTIQLCEHEKMARHMLRRIVNAATSRILENATQLLDTQLRVSALEDVSREFIPQYEFQAQVKTQVAVLEAAFAAFEAQIWGAGGRNDDDKPVIVEARASKKLGRTLFSIAVGALSAAFALVFWMGLHQGDAEARLHALELRSQTRSPYVDSQFQQLWAKLASLTADLAVLNSRIGPK